MEVFFCINKDVSHDVPASANSRNQEETSSMFYLYIKTHNKTGLKYLGKTNRADYHAYPGSGVRWKRHLDKHGYDYTTEILLATEDKDELKETGVFFSKIFDVVKSRDWANLQEEKGDGISSEFATQENYRRLEEGVHPFCDPLHNKKTNEKRQETKRKNGTHNFLGGEIQRNAYRRRVESGEQLRINAEISQRMKKMAEEGLIAAQKFVNVVDKNGNIVMIDRDDYGKDQELVHINSTEGKRRLNKPLVTEKRREYLDAKLECPHCKKKGNVSNMKRWHFDNCKSIPVL